MPEDTASSRTKSARERPAWQKKLQRFFDTTWVDLTIGALIVISVVLTIAEIAMGAASPAAATLDSVNHGLTVLFAVELTLRCLAATSRRRFFREYWIDILAVLPLLRVFRVFRALRLLRLLRMLRLLGFISRYASYFPYVIRRGALEYVIVSGLILLTLIFGSVAVLHFERGQNQEIDSLAEAFWFSLCSLFAGEPTPFSLQSFGAKVAAVGIMFMGVTIFAMLTGTVSAFMIDRLQTEGKVVDWEQLSGHIIICGWNRKTEIILAEFLAAQPGSDVPIVVVGMTEGEPLVDNPKIRERVRFLNDDFTKVAALEKAGIRRAKTCIIVSDTGRGRSEQDADARTILAALTAEKLNPDIYTCAELIHRDFGSHLEMGNVNDYVVADEHSAFLLAQAALNRGLMVVFKELLTQEHGNQFYRLPVTEEWSGKTFIELFVHLKETKNAILVAVQDAEGQHYVNPQDYTFQAGDNLVVIARQNVEL